MHRTIPTLNEPYLADPGRTVDRRQRAFRNLDTSNIDGNWVEESQYNRHNHGKGVLVGNWQEEATIDENLPSKPTTSKGPPHLNEQPHFRRGKNTATIATDLTGKRTTFFADFLNTTPKDKEPSTMMLTTGDETDFKKSLNSGKYNAPVQPKEENVIGRRKKLEEELLLQQAARELDSQDHFYSEAHKRAVLEETYKTTYHVEHDRQVQPAIPNTNDYNINDIPITFHTDKAVKQQPLNSVLHTNIYHSAPVSSTNPWNRNTTFTKPISEYKGTTKN